MLPRTVAEAEFEALLERIDRAVGEAMAAPKRSRGRAPRFRCRQCGAWHGGSRGLLCPDCHTKAAGGPPWLTFCERCGGRKRVGERCWHCGHEPEGEVRRRPALERWFEPIGESEAPDPRVIGVCQGAGRLAEQLRQAIGRTRTTAHPLHRAYAIENVRRRGAAWVNRISNQLLPILDQLHPNDLDRLVGCLARIEHAIGRETVPLRRLKAVARRRLGGS
jgi:hypothetical protein